LEAGRQENGSLPVGEESEVADADEPWRQQMEQEPAQELVDGQSHEPLLVYQGRRQISGHRQMHFLRTLRLPRHENIDVQSRDHPSAEYARLGAKRKELGLRVMGS
jgi:hypothetical protein